MGPAPDGSPPQPAGGPTRPGGGPTRAEAMARRLARTARRLGLADEDWEGLETAFRAGMARRLARELDDHHPDYLHPSRTALILMDDARVADTAVLAAALVVETRDPELAPPPDEIATLGPTAADIVAAVPRPADEGERLLETLLAAPRAARLVAAAERLDHARHLHLRPRSEWRDYHATTCAVYAPVAARTDPALAARLEWWCAAFRRRFLDG